MHKLTDVERVSQSCAAFNVPRHLRRVYVGKLAVLPFEAVHEEIVSDATWAIVDTLRLGREAVAIVRARQEAER